MCYILLVQKNWKKKNIYTLPSTGLRTLVEDLMHATRKLQRCPRFKGGARGVMVIVVGKGHGEISSNPGRE